MLSLESFKGIYRSRDYFLNSPFLFCPAILPQQLLRYLSLQKSSRKLSLSGLLASGSPFLSFPQCGTRTYRTGRPGRVREGGKGW